MTEASRPDLLSEEVLARNLLDLQTRMQSHTMVVRENSEPCGMLETSTSDLLTEEVRARDLQDSQTLPLDAYDGRGLHLWHVENLLTRAAVQAGGSGSDQPHISSTLAALAHHLACKQSEMPHLTLSPQERPSYGDGNCALS